MVNKELLILTYRLSEMHMDDNDECGVVARRAMALVRGLYPECEKEWNKQRDQYHNVDILVKNE